MFKFLNTKNNDSLFKYDKDVIWSLPVLCRYEPAWAAIYKCLQKIDVSLPTINAYGSPSNAWTGGRVPTWMGELDKTTIETTFSYLKEHNATPSLTFSYSQLKREDLNDKYTNYLLDIALDYDAHFIVYSDMLKDYIKEKDPNAYVVASITKPTFKFQNPEKLRRYSEDEETQYYNNLLEEYDMVVVRPEYARTTMIKKPKTINDISRIEVLINQGCLANCSKSPEHYKHLELFRMDNIQKSTSFTCVKETIPFKNTYNNLATIDEQTVKKLVNLGVKHLKLQGRGGNCSVDGLALMLFGQIFETNGNAYLIIEELMNVVANQETQRFVQMLQSSASQDTTIYS